MNKDVIYIEPEDDITDIISKIEKAKEKIVALVPPKKAGVFRSLVNIKLIAKAGTTAGKSVVLVTVDPSITKLAAATKLPVAKNLQSAPEIPEPENLETPDDNHSIEEIDDPDEPEDDAEVNNQNSQSDSTGSHKTKSGEDDDVDENDSAEEDEEEPIKSAKKEKKSPKLTGHKLLDWIKLHKKLSIAAGVLLVALIGFLVWAFGFAPAVDVTVTINTDTKNFSENITFVDNLADENAKEGKFYLEQKKIESAQEIEFEATGEKNVGEKASGDLIAYAYFRDSNSRIPIGPGTIFTYGNLKYAATGNTDLSWDGKDESCDNRDQASSLARSGCQVSVRIKVEATAPGSNYNVGASNSGWNTIADVTGVYSDKAMSGGTDDIKTVVQQSDIIKAKEKLTNTDEEESKAKLYDTIDDDEYFIIDNSFKQEASQETATPGVDEEVTNGTQPILKATTTTTVYVINENKLKEYIEAKAELEENQRVYDTKDLYIENFVENNGTGSAKLKAQIYIGPKITETEVVDKIKGKGLGDAQREIRDIYGVSDVTMDPSYPWVMAVPGDSNRIYVKFEVKDRDGNEVKDQSSESENNEENQDNQNNDSKNEEKS